jgi:hypothetical protein
MCLQKIYDNIYIDICIYDNAYAYAVAEHAEDTRTRVIVHNADRANNGRNTMRSSAAKCDVSTSEFSDCVSDGLLRVRAVQFNHDHVPTTEAFDKLGPRASV